jgi:hypothetical protein
MEQECEGKIIEEMKEMRIREIFLNPLSSRGLMEKVSRKSFKKRLEG